MTVSTTKAEQVHTGNAAATSFATNFKLLDAAHLVVRTRVIATGVETTRVLDTDYSVSGIDDDAGATVTYPLSGSPLPATQQIILVREVPFTQATSIKNQTGFFPEVLENAYDLIVMMAQQVRAKTDRALRFAIGSTFDAELPALDGNRTLITNSAGTAFVQGPTAAEISSAEGFATASANNAAAAAASAAEAATFDPDNFQPIDAALTQISDFTGFNDKFFYSTGGGMGDPAFLVEGTVTAAGRAILDDADAAAQRTTLGLGTAALMADSADTNLSNDPDAALRRDIAKAYVDSEVAAVGLGFDPDAEPVAVSRSNNTAYQNTTGFHMPVFIPGQAQGGTMQVSSDNSTWITVVSHGSGFGPSFTIVPPGWYYRASLSASSIIEYRAP